MARVRSPPPKVRERLKGGDRGPPSPREANGIVGLAHFINCTNVESRTFTHTSDKKVRPAHEAQELFYKQVV
jgi:hypothetical protein